MQDKMYLDQIVEEMKQVADTLVPYNWPQNHPRLEFDLNLIKARQMDLDGYSLIVHFNRADHGDRYEETLQVLGQRTSFLPFSLVARMGRLFLGTAGLSLVEILRDNRKIYCWTCSVDKTGRPLSIGHSYKTERCEYDGLKYHYIYPNQVKFY